MLPNELFEDQALRAVRFGRFGQPNHRIAKLTVDQDRVTAFIAEAAENYEDPAEVIEYYTNDKAQRAQVSLLC